MVLFNCFNLNLMETSHLYPFGPIRMFICSTRHFKQFTHIHTCVSSELHLPNMQFTVNVKNCLQLLEQYGWAKCYTTAALSQIALCSRNNGEEALPVSWLPHHTSYIRLLPLSLPWKSYNCVPPPTLILLSPRLQSARTNIGPTAERLYHGAPVTPPQWQRERFLWDLALPE